MKKPRQYSPSTSQGSNENEWLMTQIGATPKGGKYELQATRARYLASQYRAVLFALDPDSNSEIADFQERLNMAQDKFDAAVEELSLIFDAISHIVIKDHPDKRKLRRMLRAIDDLLGIGTGEARRAEVQHPIDVGRGPVSVNQIATALGVQRATVMRAIRPELTPINAAQAKKGTRLLFDRADVERVASEQMRDLNWLNEPKHSRHFAKAISDF